MSQRKKCAFCGNDAAKISGEHIWSAWIGRLLGARKYTWKFTDPETGQVKLWKGLLDTKANVVCKPCNEGWMSQLECEAKRELSDIIVGAKEVALSPRGVVTLAAFTFKNAIVANYMNMKREPFFPPAVRQRFRSTLEIPSDVQMWLAAFGGTYKSGTFIGHVSGPAVTPDYRGPWKDFEFYAFTYSVGGLVVQLLAPRWAPIHRRGLPVPILQPNGIWDKVGIQFWPSDGSSVDWPPPQYLDDNSIDAFTNRWTAPVRFVGW